MVRQNIPRKFVKQLFKQGDPAKIKGFRFRPVDRVAALPDADLIARIEALGRTRAGKRDRDDIDAILGGAAKPRVTVAGALAVFFVVTRRRTRGNTRDQLRIWKKSRKKAVANFVEVVGGLPLEEITADAMFDLRKWWWNRVTEGGVTINSANKNLGTLGNILKTVNEKKPSVSHCRFRAQLSQ